MGSLQAQIKRCVSGPQAELDQSTVLCTADKTYEVKVADTSNTLFMAIPGDDAGAVGFSPHSS